MNINAMRNVVVQGQIATLEGQIETWEIYSKRTNEDVSSIITQINIHIAALKLLLVNIP